MKFGRFEISEYAIGVIAFVALIAIALNAIINEEKVKEKTRQLELQKEIIILERGNENGTNTN